MKNIKAGDTVQILCEAKLETGELCYKNDAENLIQIVVGEGNFFPVIEKAMQEMTEGESRVLTLEAEDAFGPHVDDLIIKIPRSVFKQEVTLDVGSRVKIDAPTGKSFIGSIIAMDEQTITLDLNHLLAGKRLVVSVTVVSIAEPVKQE
ncbi:MAG TPA: FKBP-type peptidyl-prolyl cis-trans isomerase [Candidatus Thermoplasmatota archaeon]|nr:FKBP-type peptidyl-prolyl cis-trans isomerase [Candidatus Thermoplasmatota archaeon]